MSEFFGILGKLSENGLVKIAGYTVLGFLGAEGIACLSGYNLEIGKQGISCHKHSEGHLPVRLSVYRNEETA